MTELYFIRHAESDPSVHEDATRPLTEKGMADSGQITELFHDKRISAVISSPYLRSVETVTPTAKEKGLTIQIVDDFRERAMAGWLEDYTAYVKRQWQDFDYKEAGGESLAEVQTRNIHAIEQVLVQYENKKVIIGCHATALGTVIKYYNSAFQYEEFEKVRLVMPYIVKLVFEGVRFVSMTPIQI